MRDKILKLAKRLNKFTLEEIESILNCENLQEILDEIANEKLLQFQNGTYFYIKKESKKSDLPLFFQFHTKEEIDMIIKCFCADIPVLKSNLLVESSKTVVGNFYNYFRDKLFEKQSKELLKYFEQNPKMPAIRTLYDIKIYLYFYEGKVFVADKELKSKKIMQKHPEVEMREIRVAYYKVRRVFQNFAFTQSLYEIAAEKIWRQGKEFEQLKNEIYFLLAL
jgi:hypothetical protein